MALTIPDENAKSGRGHSVRGSPIAANRTAALLGQLFKFGIPHCIVTSTSVQLLFSPRRQEKARKHVLSDEELQILLSDPISARAMSVWLTCSYCCAGEELRRTVRRDLARLNVEPHIAERVLHHAQATVAATYDRHGI